MAPSRAPSTIAALLSFNGGFVDAVAFFGLAGLFVGHVTGNFVTLGATLVLGSHGIFNKVLALPEFVGVIILARLLGNALRARHLPALRIMLVIEAVLLAAFFGLAVAFGPFADADSALGLLTGFAGVAAMAVQNGLQRVHMPSEPPTTIMTGNTTQAALDCADVLIGPVQEDAMAARARLTRVATSIGLFAAGCAAAAALYVVCGFWSLALPVVIAAIAAFISPDART